MTTNKTPIQELFKMLDEHYAFVCTNQDEWLEKEKAFAFDCFEAGKDYGFDVCMAIDWGDNPTKQDFDQFYVKYAEQHNK